MIAGHIAFASGAPTATAVLDRRTLPPSEDDLLVALLQLREALVGAGRSDVLKIALISPGEHPLDDLDYRFVQVQPGNSDRLDPSGSCAHSAVASAVVADRLGWISPLLPGARVRIRSVVNDDRLVCQVAGLGGNEATFSVHFIPPRAPRLRELMPTGEARTTLDTAAGCIQVSLVASGNIYAFVDARDLGIWSRNDLFAAGDRFFHRLLAIRSAAALRLGLPREGVFPKIAAIGPFSQGRIVARAISVPTWHPAIALTGAVCLATACVIAGSIPNAVAREAACDDWALVIETPGGGTVVRTTMAGRPPEAALGWITVHDKRVRFEETVPLLAARVGSRLGGSSS